MNCDWTSKISSLIDGELSTEESAQMEAHLLACADCQRTREDFLLLRRQLSSYQAQTTPDAQQQALQSILASGSPAASVSKARKNTSSRRGLLDSLSLIFGAQRSTPALMTALVLLLFAIALGLYSYLNSHSGPSKDTIAHSNNAPANTAQSNTNHANTNAQDTAPQVAARSRDGARSVAPSHKMAGRVLIARERRLPAGLEVTTGNLNPGLKPDGSALSRSIADLKRFDRTLAGDPQARTARYVEQAQLLLRSFRNARQGETGPAFDIAHEKLRSQRLLYQNIVLRREAASKGNVPVEKLLSSLEPILIDIANLPDNPAQDDVRSIRERMQRKNIVALLQVNSGPATRSN